MQRIWRDRREFDTFWRGWIVDETRFWTPAAFYNIAPWSWANVRFHRAFAWSRP